MSKSSFLITLLLPVLFLFMVHDVRGNVQLPAVFSNHMVLQQNSEVTVWGWAKTGEEVTVIPSWNNTPIKVKADNLAKWQVKLQTPAAGGGPYTIKVQGYNTIEIEDVLIGEVWLCSGQSNMEWTARAGIDHAAEEVPKANYPSIRFFSVQHRTADAPQLDLNGEWVVCTPKTMIDFSAVGYFFGRELYQNLNVPVGLINSSWGGTPAEIWMNADTIAADKELAEAAAELKEVEWGPVQPGKAYNAMIAPLIPFKIAGALWYQGEANTGNPEEYAQLLPALIRNWRSEWNSKFPFYFVQIAPWKDYAPQQGVLLRDAQRRSLRVPNTGMVVVSDIGNNDNIHPTNKIDVGVRLANWALNKTYGKKDIVFSGPLYRDMKVEGKKIRIFFDHIGKGLVTKGKELTGFEIAGPDQKFVKANAKIDGNTVVVQAKSVKNPVAVRFEWSNAVDPNLFNTAGLPASSFRTDDWKVQ
ncbi:sialate O-acetylesterase [Pontibacter silvestris]|uniref:Sialate O-acetylesterase n=1 Tax=Pontibacter silvestris TaxID=2305183 RepID=A0ABW4WY14_9BACT|nr:sialate O-acetylesterase [Pontibacter silvestris]MCC9137607.1 sialate O-acetylesterase [Pontibacter silvestris]